jgi:hypothetical protein
MVWKETEEVTVILRWTILYKLPYASLPAPAALRGNNVMSVGGLAESMLI